MPSVETAASAAPEGVRASILVIDDDEILAEVVASVLREQGYEVTQCNDASLALSRIRAGHIPDLILLDLMMPRMTGWEFRVEQRKQPGLASIPVIAMSADSSAQALAIDADDYLEKPLCEEQLLKSVARVLDAMQRKRHEEQHAELERLSALGVLAAGIAHEINNPLTAVLGNLQIARHRLAHLAARLADADRDELAANLAMIEAADQGAERIASVVRNVSSFARPGSDALAPINLVEVLESSIELLANEIRHHAKLLRDYHDLPTVMANATKLGQVFINLLTNALHAVRDSPGKAHQIRVAIHQSPEGDVVVSISDTGLGMSSAVAQRVFDPFFTTKASGVGTGLGLAICHRLMTSMGGTIRVESVVEQGSTFRVVLPSQGFIAAPEGIEEPRRTRPRGLPKARLLVIDDEKMVCDLLVRLLGSDYDVSTQTEPRAALAQLLSGDEFDLILCDLMMPELTGMDLHAEVARIRPGQAARMLFMTGGTFTPRSQQFVERLQVAHVRKPFVVPELEKTIASCLASHGTMGADSRWHN